MLLNNLWQVDWSQRYDVCHKQLPRLSAQGIQQFVDSITFSELAVDTIPVENRVEIVNRALRFARQQDAALKKKGISESQEERYKLFVVELNIGLDLSDVCTKKGKMVLFSFVIFRGSGYIIGYKFSSHRILHSFDSLRISRTDRKKHFTRTYTSILTVTEIIDIFLTFVVREHYYCKFLLFDVGFYLLTFSEEAYDITGFK